MSDPILEAQSDLRGPVRIWEPPQRGFQYVIGADVAEGLEKGDFSAAWVIRAHDLRHVASWHGKTDPFGFAEELNWLGRFYNNALLAPEKNNHGESVIRNLLHTQKYPNLYYRSEKADKRAGGPRTIETAEYGWLTRKPQKMRIQAMLNKVLNARVPIFDHRIYVEGLTWVLDEDGVPDTAPNANDDLLIAAGIAYCVAAEKYKVDFVMPAPARPRSPDQRRKDGNRRKWKDVLEHNRGRNAQAAEQALRSVPGDLMW